MPLNLAEPQSIEQAVEIFQKTGPVNVLVNNAGVWPSDEEHDGTTVAISTLRHVLEINLIGTINLTERILATSLIKEDGKIISLGSDAGVITW